MKHLGDITKINGAEIEPVDCITGGSPCQDLSVAGKRAGLAGERSGLFMEQIRIVKEMREHDRRIKRADDDFRLRPRYMVWENVPGVFSSNKGQDFQAVLTEIVRIVRPDAPDVPLPDRGGWSKSGCIMGYGATGCPFSIAWRLHDAQFWGVPQRRKRIALVADFGGSTAPEILFERKGVSGDIEESGETGEGAAADVRSGVEETGGAVVYGISPFDSGGFKSNNPHAGIYQAETARSLDLSGGNPACNQGGMAVVCLEGNGSRPSHKGDGYAESDTMYTLNSTEHHAVAYGIDQQGGKGGAAYTVDVAPTMASDSHGTPHAVCIENHPADSRVKVSEDGIVQTLSSRMGTGGGNVSMVMEEPYNATTGSFMRAGNSGIAETLAAIDYKGPQIVCNSVVRIFTPLECERLQGFPDGWTDIGEWVDSKGKKHKESDSPRYKALGNSIAVGYANNGSGFWMWLLKRISAQYERNATLGSLFDGIGGFPLAWEHFNGKGSARWASEIEEFPIAVTKKHFPED